MFRTLIYPSSGACDFVDELQVSAGWSTSASTCKTNTTKYQLQQKLQRTENKTTDVVIHQQSRRLLKMDILMSETCWAHNKWNKITSYIKLVFHSSAQASCSILSHTDLQGYCWEFSVLNERDRSHVTWAKIIFGEHFNSWLSNTLNFKFNLITVQQDATYSVYCAGLL